MQLRRRPVWIALLAVAVLFFGLERRFWVVDPHRPLREVFGAWALVVNFLLPIPFGMLLADRLPRDRQTGVDEPLAALPAPHRSRLWGKYLGSFAATLLPLLVVYLAGVAHIAVVRGDARAVPLGLAAFALVNVPGLLFVGAFSIACPAVLWVPLYQFLFAAYWFWGNFIPPQLLPSLSETWIAPIGRNASEGFFGAGFAQGPDSHYVTKSATDGVGSILTLLVMSAAALLVVESYLRQQQRTQ
jgi:hypothetical protein